MGQEALDKIIRAGITLAKDRKWMQIQLEDIAREAGLQINDLKLHVTSRVEILHAYSKRLDIKALNNVGEADEAIPAKDRVFDVVMERFELMNEDREALRNIIKSIDPDPYAALTNCFRLKQSMTTLLDGAGISTKGLVGRIKVKALAVIYLLTLKTWLEDDSPDLSKTMASLDKHMKRAEQMATTFRLGETENDTYTETLSS